VGYGHGSVAAQAGARSSGPSVRWRSWRAPIYDHPTPGSWAVVLRATAEGWGNRRGCARRAMGRGNGGVARAWWILGSALRAGTVASPLTPGLRFRFPRRLSNRRVLAGTIDRSGRRGRSCAGGRQTFALRSEHPCWALRRCCPDPGDFRVTLPARGHRSCCHDLVTCQRMIGHISNYVIASLT
jgi:hypothetical protein